MALFLAPQVTSSQPSGNVVLQQVYDLARTAPGDVLVHGLGLLEKLAEAGDACAQATRTNLRIMVLPVPFPLVIAFVSGHKSLVDYPQPRCS